jgi:hypothetical protein
MWLITTLAAAAITALLVLVDPPQMPLYQVASLKIRELTLTSLWTMQISSTILAGLQVHNPNVIGVNIHATNVDLWYPDWKGDLQWIGYLTQTEEEDAALHCGQEREMRCLEDEQQQQTTVENNKGKDDGGSQCLNEEWKRLPSEPFVSIHPRSTTISHACAVSIHIPNLSPSIYFRILLDAITRGGEIQILVSGVAHVKSQSISTNLGIPLTLGVICDNSIQVTQRPIQIAGRTCVVEGVATGWTALEESTFALRERAKEIYEIKGVEDKNSVLETAVAGTDDLDSWGSLLQSPDAVFDWHVF